MDFGRIPCLPERRFTLSMLPGASSTPEKLSHIRSSWRTKIFAGGPLAYRFPASRVYSMFPLQRGVYEPRFVTTAIVWVILSSCEASLVAASLAASSLTTLSKASSQRHTPLAIRSSERTSPRGLDPVGASTTNTVALNAVI